MSDIYKINVNGIEYDLKDALLKTASGLGHNGIYRGKNLGTITAANIATFISDHGVTTGAFTDLYLGDEVTIQDGTYNSVWIIAGFDTEWQKGSSEALTHHVSLIPQTHLLSAPWHASGTPAGYWGSDINTSTIATIVNNLNSCLGTHLLTRSILPSTAISTTGVSMAGAGFTGYSSSWGWQNARATLLTEVQVYGTTVCSSSFYDVGEANEKLPVFNFISPCTRSYWWLRSVAGGSNACYVPNNGYAGYNWFANSYAVRPLICIG